MNGLQAVEDLALYLHRNQSVKVFKFEKATGYSEEYIVVNHLPFVFGKTVSDSNILNVNLHAPKLSSGNEDVPALTNMLKDIEALIPYDVDMEDMVGVNINGSYYSITSVSQPIEDKDNTYFLNVRIKIITNQLIL